MSVRRKKVHNLILFNLLLVLFLVIGIHELLLQERYLRLQETIIQQDGFRRQSLTEDSLKYIQTIKDPGEYLGLYWLETDFGKTIPSLSPSQESFENRAQMWKKQSSWPAYVGACRSIWNEIKYFPIPEPSEDTKAGVSFVDSWMFERNYGGKRGHEGTDIMPEVDKRGYYPIVSMTDGVVRHKGWLEQGGWRIGIASSQGAYFYYAHMDSYADIQVGDNVKAGDLLGYMGDTGYGKKEGTKGKFPVHLHVGIYLLQGDQEISVDPYWALRYVENRKIKCVYSR